MLFAEHEIVALEERFERFADAFGNDARLVRGFDLLRKLCQLRDGVRRCLVDARDLVAVGCDPGLEQLQLAGRRAHLELLDCEQAAQANHVQPPVGQFLGLPEDVFGDGDLAEIVQAARRSASRGYRPA